LKISIGGGGGGGNCGGNSGKRRGDRGSRASRATVDREPDIAGNLTLGLEGGRGSGMALRCWFLGNRTPLLLLCREFGMD